MIFTITFKARLASSPLVITGAIRCGIFTYCVNSTFLGSINNILTSSGFVLIKIEHIIEFTQTLLPLPVAPAIKP